MGAKIILSDHDEILRLRDRYHELSNEVTKFLITVEGNRVRIESLEKTKKEHTERIGDLEDQSAIAEAVKEALHQNHRLQLSGIQKAGSFILFCLTVAALVKEFLP